MTVNLLCLTAVEEQRDTQLFQEQKGLRCVTKKSERFMQCQKLVTEFEMWSINQLKTSRNHALGLQATQSSEFYKVTTEQYQKAAEEVEAKFKRYEYHPVCADLQAQILQCYRQNTQQTLSCSALASQYMRCVNQAKQENGREGQREASSPGPLVGQNVPKSRLHSGLLLLSLSLPVPPQSSILFRFPLFLSLCSENSGWLHLFGIFVDTPVNLMLILSDIGDTPQIIIERLCDSCLMKLFFLLNDAKEAAFISA
ncbi:hypothetical protein E5288_WYG002842 [Bos mutus]|uniref:Coiled-coil-helix-coiled-coil-helix domain-containing protein 3, mitochondrial n=1 Tax=Bos mutus TaxID=72004 RepID=A0A6B0RRW4_9CETA|nr:hypothetical protein [Bos mutus]